MIHAQVQSTQAGAFIFDATLAPAPELAWLDRAHWPARSREGDGGRGGVLFADTPIGACVLRHYHRGGLVARLSRDTYLWLGNERSRAFREFRLLARLVDAGLPVPAPVAARIERKGLRYRADLLMRRIEQAQTLAQRIAAGAIDDRQAQAIGTTLARFHRHGVWHADLNAHNILIGADGKVWLIDFDRGRLRPPRLAWQRANLGRLRRSLDKLGARRVAEFDRRFWHPLLAAYHAQMAQAEDTPKAIA
ncbi:MAG: 3-deoxy-D-manno-octulosonic acid kinase [Dokdonella sp.]|nr:3-deoxy-D-manno-octulosonic acid kinase [Dokdonella sp.]